MERRKRKVMLFELSLHGGQPHGEQPAMWQELWVKSKENQDTVITILKVLASTSWWLVILEMVSIFSH